MRIIICCQNLYGGGAERVASLWAKGFRKQGHEVIFFLAENKISYDTFNSEVFIIGSGSKTIIQYIKWYRLFKREFGRLKPDVFISVNHPWAPIAKLASIGFNIKIVSTEHNAYEKPDYIKMNYMDRLHKFVLNKYVDYVTVLTQVDKDYIGPRLKNVYVLPNPLSFEPIQVQLDKDKVILAVGRLNSWHVKGFDLLISSWLRLYNKYPDWKLKIVGYGSEESKKFLYKLGSDIPSSQFEISNFDNNIITQYQKASIFILSSRYEGFGMVLIEAMSQGCACIGCDYKGRQKEIITNGVDGTLISSNNDEKLTEALDQLLSNPSMTKNYELNAIKTSNKYRLENTMKTWDVILNISNK